MPKALLLGGLLFCLLLPSLLYAKAHFAPLALAKFFSVEEENPVYWVSEKFDGIRCYWDGNMLLTRKANQIHAPKWFTDQLPKTPLDGELWAGYGGYQTVSKIVLDGTPDSQQWQKIQYKVFDLPNNEHTFERRQDMLKTLLAGRSEFIQPVTHNKMSGQYAINQALQRVLVKGGEGLMLRVPGSLYEAGRSDNLLKYKLRQDSEARVIAYQAGRGKFENMMGAIWVELENGKMFKIGTGFTNIERQDPPPIGSQITFSHEGFTDKGLPRFASFERVRHEE